MQGDAAHIRARLEALFQEIETARMDGIPILNRALSVAAIGFEPYQDYFVGVLVTPWFMNLTLLPQDPDKFCQNPPQMGDKKMLNLPAGQVEFIVGYEESLGYMLSCSLFSPVFEFEDQAAAIETASAALAEVLNNDCKTQEDETGMRDIWEGRLPEPEVDAASDPADPESYAEPALPPRDVSRRDFLRGRSAREQDEIGETA